SPAVKILALVGLVAALGLGASTLVLGHSSSKTAAKQAVVTHARVTTAKPTVRPTHPKAAPKFRAKTAAKPVARPHHARAAAKKAAKPKPVAFHGNPVYATLPQPLQWQLAHHKIVVVSIYNPKSGVDAISVAEAHAGAVDA